MKKPAVVFEVVCIECRKPRYLAKRPKGDYRCKRCQAKAAAPVAAAPAAPAGDPFYTDAARRQSVGRAPRWVPRRPWFTRPR